jgi:Zn finger protein HypA/HybF involved in hydrogenase expression
MWFCIDCRECLQIDADLFGLEKCPNCGGIDFFWVDGGK